MKSLRGALQGSSWWDQNSMSQSFWREEEIQHINHIQSPSIKHILREKISYVRSFRNLHELCVAENLGDYDNILFDFKTNDYFSFEEFLLPMTFWDSCNIQNCLHRGRSHIFFCNTLGAWGLLQATTKYRSKKGRFTQEIAKPFWLPFLHFSS